MLQSSSRSTAVPLPLLIVTAILLLVRLGLFVNEQLHPQVVRQLVKWQELKSVPKPDFGGKMYLFFFNANWCAAGRSFDEGSLENPSVAKFINENFIPVKLVDQKRETDKNPPVVQELETKFHVQMFPTTVISVSAPNLDVIDRHSGSLAPQQFLELLHGVAREAPYKLGLAALLEGRDSLAQQYFKNWLTPERTVDENTAYAALFQSSLMIIDRTAPLDEAKELLQQIRARAVGKSWPNNLLPYLEIPRAKLLDVSASDESHGEETEAHYFAAVAAYAKDDRKTALQDLDWISANCPSDEFYCARLARRFRAKIKESTPSK